MEQRLERGDVRLILICLAITIVSLAVGTHYFYQAFPEATIDFRLTREEARAEAASFLDHRGFDLDGYHHAAIFNFDNSTKTFLEFELGLQGASELIDRPVRLWRWSHRWFQELEKEEFRVEITTAGDLVGFRHELPEEAPGPQLEQDEARAQAEQFLIHAMGHDLADLEFVEAGTTQRPERSDHTFTWKLAGFEVGTQDAGDATYRYRVIVQGDRVGGYDEFLKLPEAWQDDYEELRSHNQATGIIAALFLVFTWAAMAILVVKRIRLQDVRWQLVLVFGAVTFVLAFLAELNNLPVATFGFDTTGTLSSFFTEHVMLALAGALAQALFIAFLTASAEPVYRQHFKDQISLSEQFLPDGIRTKRFLIGTVIGLTMTAGFVAYQVIFYLVAERFGAWGPADIPYGEMVNTHVPWVVVLLIGWLPAVSEEFTSRAFSIPFFQGLVKHRWIAVVLSAVIWGFAHAGYPQQPFWIRGLEVSLAGIVVGYVVIRWGLLPALVWHYTIDALYTALILLRSSNAYYVTSAALSVGLMLLPLLVAIALYARRHYFIDPGSLLNSEDAAPAAKPVPSSLAAPVSSEAQISAVNAPTPIYHPLTRQRWMWATAAVAIGCIVFFTDRHPALPELDITFTADEAESVAIDWMQDQGVDVERYSTVAYAKAQWDMQAVDYRAERADLTDALAPFGAELATAIWSVRFFEPGEKEEWTLSWLPQDTSLYRVQHVLPADAAGADLTEQEAQAIAHHALIDLGIDTSVLERKDVSTEKLENRRDHWFAWETPEGNRLRIEESRLRYDVHIAGDAVADVHRSIKLPEQWLRERRESTLWRTFLSWMPRAGIAAVVLHMLWLLIGTIRTGTIRWQRPIWFAAVGAGCFLMVFLNGLPAFLVFYPTQIPMGVFSIIQGVVTIIATLFMGLMLAAASGLFASLFQGTLDSLSRGCLRAWLPDALGLSLLAAVAGFSADRWATWLVGVLPASVPIHGPTIPGHLSDFVPVLSGAIGAFSSGLQAPLAIAVIVFYACRVIRRPSLIVVALLMFFGASAGADAYTAVEFCIALGRSALLAAVYAIALACFFRDNLLAYCLAAFVTATAKGAVQLLQQSNESLQWQGGGWIFITLLIIGALWLWAKAPEKHHPS